MEKRGTPEGSRRNLREEEDLRRTKRRWSEESAKPRSPGERPGSFLEAKRSTGIRRRSSGSGW